MSSYIIPCFRSTFAQKTAGVFLTHGVQLTFATTWTADCKNDGASYNTKVARRRISTGMTACRRIDIFSIWWSSAY